VVRLELTRTYNGKLIVTDCWGEEGGASFIKPLFEQEKFKEGLINWGVTHQRGILLRFTSSWSPSGLGQRTRWVGGQS